MGFKEFLNESEKIKQAMKILQKEFGATVVQPLGKNNFGMTGMEIIFDDESSAKKSQDKLATRLEELGFSPDFKKATKSSSTIILPGGKKKESSAYKMLGFLKK